MNSDTGKSDVEDIDGFEIETQKVDWNIFFANPGFSEVANRILKSLDYKSIKTCRDVSPIWKENIDLHGQKILRLKKLFSLRNAKYLPF